MPIVLLLRTPLHPRPPMRVLPRLLLEVILLRSLQMTGVKNPLLQRTAPHVNIARISTAGAAARRAPQLLAPPAGEVLPGAGPLLAARMAVALVGAEAGTVVPRRSYWATR
jgi:hypothetical protein